MRTLAFLILAAALHAQTFEAASIHPNPGGNEGSVVDFEDSGLLRASNASLKMLIRSAYGVQADQIIGGPKWLDSDRYDIEAKTAGRINESDEQPLLQHLLAGRFHLKTHAEQRELTIYKAQSREEWLPSETKPGEFEPDPQQPRRGPEPDQRDPYFHPPVRWHAGEVARPHRSG